MDSISTAGTAIPRLGLGTYRMTGPAAQEAVERGLALGYRHLDTAAMYGNEAEVGAAIAASGLPRDALFVTTKVWHDRLGSPDAMRAALQESLGKLGLDRVDLYHIHWPSAEADMDGAIRTLVALRDEGLATAIGVCNFNRPMLVRAVDDLGAPLATVQVEYHPFLDQSKLLGWLRGHGIPLTAYAPLAQGRAAQDPVLQRIGAKHGVSAAQIALAWLMDQPDVIAIPKASRQESQQANLDALEVALDEDDRAAIAALPKDLRYVRPAMAPDWDAEP